MLWKANYDDEDNNTTTTNNNNNNNNDIIDHKVNSFVEHGNTTFPVNIVPALEFLDHFLIKLLNLLEVFAFFNMLGKMFYAYVV